MEEYKSQDERREHRRIEWKFIARFQIRPHENEKAQDGWDIVTARNLGAGGVLFNYDKKLDVDTILDFKINFPACEEPVVCVAKVIRVDKPVAFGVIPVAAIFQEINDKEKETIGMIAEKMHLGEPTGTILDKPLGLLDD